MLLRYIIALFLCTAPLYAGSGPAFITGKTSSGRTSLKLSVEDIINTINSVELTIDGQSYTLKNDHKSCREIIIDDFKNGVYALVLESDTHMFKLWMIPGSEKITKRTNSQHHSTFSAVIEATDPRKSDKWSMTPRITIGCTLKYDI